MKNIHIGNSMLLGESDRHGELLQSNLTPLQPLVFLCGARDFHAMDWHKSAKELSPDKEIYILTDLIAGEGFKKIINDSDKVFKLIIIDKFLFKKQSGFGNIWRNFIKLLVFPIQIFLIRKFSHKYPRAIYHAHSMYYLFLAWAAGICYVGTPQGSDILIKPFKSWFYRCFAIKSLAAAKAITVDSDRMKEKVFELTGLDAHVIQNGIDLEAISTFLNHSKNHSANRDILLSIRALTPLYRIKDIVKARNSSIKLSNIALTFIYPFYENEYKKEVVSLFKPIDKDLGRMERIEMYKLLSSSKLVFSIPYSDSSPRSVYEAIFCGCAVGITHNSYYDVLPQCMKSRIVVVDLHDKDWLEIAIEKSNKIISKQYYPSDEALILFDQKKSFRKMEELLFS